MNIQRLHVGKRLSEVAIHNGVVWLAGQIPNNCDLDITAQTKSVLQQIDQLLAEAGSSKSHLLFAQVFLAEMKLFDQFNAVWDDWVVAEQTPPRATVEAKLADPKCLIEIVVRAAQID